MFGPSQEVTASVTRPAGNTTQYAVGDLIANSATAGSVTLMSWTFAGSGLWLRRIKLTKSDPDVTSASFRLWLINDAAVVFTNGDNGALALTSGLALADIVLAADITVDKTLPGVGDVGYATFDAGLYPIAPAPNANGTRVIYGFLEARGTYTPGDAEVFTVALRGDPL